MMVTVSRGWRIKSFLFYSVLVHLSKGESLQKRSHVPNNWTLKEWDVQYLKNEGSRDPFRIIFEFNDIDDDLNYNIYNVVTFLYLLIRKITCDTFIKLPFYCSSKGVCCEEESVNHSLYISKGLDYVVGTMNYLLLFGLFINMSRCLFINEMSWCLILHTKHVPLN